MIRLWLTQILAIIRLEMRKTFFNRRSLWIYLLASAPVILYITNAFFVTRHRQKMVQRAIEYPVSSQALDELEGGLTLEEGLAREKEIAMPVFATKDAREGPRAFKEKRKPKYIGE